MHLNTFNAQFLKHLNKGFFICIHDHTFWVQHQYVHRKPLGSKPHWVIIRHHRPGNCHQLYTPKKMVKLIHIQSFS